MDMGYTINRPPRDGHMAFVRSPDKFQLKYFKMEIQSQKNLGLQWKIPARGKSIEKKNIRYN